MGIRIPTYVPRSAAVQKYLQTIRSYPILSRDAELACLQAYRAGDMTARDTLVNSHQRFAAVVALRYEHTGVPIEDLIHESTLGIFDALEQEFDETRGFRFLSFAFWRMFNRIMNAIRNEYNSGDYLKTEKIQEIRNAMAAEILEATGRVLTEADLDEFGLSHEELYRAHRTTPALRLDMSSDDGAGTQLHDRIPDTTTPAPDSFIHEQDYTALVDTHLSALTQIEAQAIRLLAGVDQPTGVRMNSKQIAEHLHITNEKLVVIISRAERKLKHSTGKTAHTRPPPRRPHANRHR